MKKYKITYISSTDNDCCSVWTSADSKQEAISIIESEYWDVKEVISCSEMK